MRTVVLAVSIGAARCGGGTPTQPGPMPKAVASVTVNGWLSPLAVGQAVQLSATAIWNDGTSRSVTTEAAWQTTDSTVAVVSSAGLVLAQGGGTATVRATYQGVGGALSVAVEGTTLPSGPLPGLTCGTERWAVKTLSDASANAVDVLNVQQTSIRDLNTKATHCDGGPNIRGHAEEFSVYEVVGRVTFVPIGRRPGLSPRDRGAGGSVLHDGDGGGRHRLPGGDELAKASDAGVCPQSAHSAAWRPFAIVPRGFNRSGPRRGLLRLQSWPDGQGEKLYGAASDPGDHNGSLAGEVGRCR